MPDLSDNYTYNNKKKRFQFECSVPNPAETEEFHQNKYVGIVYRGNGLYGWASHNDPLKNTRGGHFIIHYNSKVHVVASEREGLLEEARITLQTYLTINSGHENMS